MINLPQTRQYICPEILQFLSNATQAQADLPKMSPTRLFFNIYYRCHKTRQDPEAHKPYIMKTIEN